MKRKPTAKDLLKMACLYREEKRSGGGIEFVCQHKSHRAIIALPGEHERIRKSLINSGAKVAIRPSPFLEE